MPHAPAPARPRGLFPFALTAALALLFAACPSPEAPPPEAAPGDATPAEIPAGTVSLELRNEPVFAVAEKLASAAGKAIVIDADAQAVAHCARITLLTGGPMPTANAIRLLREALEPAGLSLIDSETGGIILRRIPDKPLPDTCAASTGGAYPPEPELLPGTANADADKFAAGVRKISDTEYEITQASIDLMLADQTALLRSARIVPSIRDGKTAGLKVFGIRPKSVLSTLGLKNGDLILDVGGYSVTSPDTALDAYSKIRKAKSFDVAIERRGAPQKITYRIVAK